jgi:hypothetical protein
VRSTEECDSGGDVLFRIAKFRIEMVVVLTQLTADHARETAILTDETLNRVRYFTREAEAVCVVITHSMKCRRLLRPTMRDRPVPERLYHALYSAETSLTPHGT